MMNNLNAEIASLISDFCMKIDDDTAPTVMRLAKAVIESPIPDDGHVAHALWLLEERCANAMNATNAKTIIIAGSPQFHDLIASLNEGQW